MPQLIVFVASSLSDQDQKEASAINDFVLGTENVPKRLKTVQPIVLALTSGSPFLWRNPNSLNLGGTPGSLEKPALAFVAWSQLYY